MGNWLTHGAFALLGVLLIARFVFWRRWSRTGRILFVAGYVGIILAVMSYPYVLIEFVKNEGPDDWGASLHAGYTLGPKYGYAPKLKYQFQSFDPDPNGSGSGIYRLQFQSGEASGTIFCHYDKTTHKFDRDEIKPDP